MLQIRLQGTSNAIKMGSTALANAEVEIAFDPMNTETIKVMYQDMEPVFAHRVQINAFCDKTPPLPIGMTDSMPETSRFLDALEKKYKEDYRAMQQFGRELI